MRKAKAVIKKEHEEFARSMLKRANTEPILCHLLKHMKPIRPKTEEDA